ncbi:MAG: Arylsulfatase [bacterium ADurb.Bin429]|nr:MAG: Arylsulfatase [bacterium ADurb.Bin429]
MPQQPNILFLFSDQHHAGALGCAGHPRVRTPALDALAARGVRCARAFAQSPICTPSRVCYFSGQYALNHGYYGLDGAPPLHIPSLFTAFRGAGYRTGMVGKIHTPPGWLSRDCDLTRDGYGHEYAPVRDLSLTPPEALGCWEEFPRDDYSDYLTGKGLRTERDDLFLQEWYAAHGACAGQGLDARPSRLGPDDTFEAWTAAEAGRFLEEAGDDPFCLWVSFPHPHPTYAPAAPFWELYDDDLPLPPSAHDDLADRHPTLRAERERQRAVEWAVFEPRDWNAARRRVLRGYYGCVSQMDDAVGRVLARLDALGLRENTIVVYASDHGDFMLEHGLIEKAPGIGSRAVTQVPMLWSWPGHLPEGETCGALAESVDVLPTLCALAGLPAPDWTDGHDLTGVLAGDTDAVRDVAVTEGPYAHAVHTRRYTLVHYPAAMSGGAPFTELFDHDTDPGERVNLAADPAYQDIVHDLRAHLLDWTYTHRRKTTLLPLLTNTPTAADGAVSHAAEALLLEGEDWRRNYL